MREPPYAHYTFILFREAKDVHIQPAYVNTVIATEPSSTENKTLRDVILMHILHQPCGELNQSVVCMEE